MFDAVVKLAEPLKSCLGPCLGKSQHTTVEPSYSLRYSGHLRANLNLPPPRQSHDSLPRAPPRVVSIRSPRDNVRLVRLNRDLYRQSSATAGNSEHRSLPIRPNPRSRRPSSELTTSWTTTVLTSHALGELFDRIHEFMSHVPYTICGLGAMVDHGLTTRSAYKVTILCAESNKDVIKVWSATSPMAASQGLGNSGTSAKNQGDIALRMRDGALRRVRIKYMPDAGFQSLQIVQSRHSQAKVLSLSSQIEHIANAWLMDADCARDAACKKATVMEGDIMWCLHDAAAHGRGLDERYLGKFLGSESFFQTFTDRHPEAKFLLQNVGVDVAGVLKRFRNHEEISEHEELLRQYGALPPMQPNDENGRGLGLITDQPSAWQGMKVLGRQESRGKEEANGDADGGRDLLRTQKSVYTLWSQSTRSEVTNSVKDRSRVRMGMPNTSEAIAQDYMIGMEEVDLADEARGRDKGKGGDGRVRQVQVQESPSINKKSIDIVHGGFF